MSKLKQSFQGKLPNNNYTFEVKTGKRIRKFLEAHGCCLDVTRPYNSKRITVYCGGLYNYDIGVSRAVDTTPKEFKRIVREALGESNETQEH